MGQPQPDWELAADQLGHVIVNHPEAFADKSRFSMDWYYPVLAGPVRGPGAAARLDDGWPDFVVPGLGARCVSDQPWVTGAETCELVLALDAIGARGPQPGGGPRHPRGPDTEARRPAARDHDLGVVRCAPSHDHDVPVRSRTRSEPSTATSVKVPEARARR